ncbi:nuclear transport factor 2 family protein [Brevibacillus ginsengisoli]|uniref:nuclear transport factor 2 family protein n=1 Tax=Brevibacillus ginsengisoli TaxID=363854 RepID=UPI003CFBB05D
MKKWLFNIPLILLTIGIPTGLAAPQVLPHDAKPPTPSVISKANVQKWIETQGKEKNYYFPGLNYQLLNLDEDPDMEIVATIDGAVHLGNFFVLDKQAGSYKLIAERNWKVEKLSAQPLIEPNGKKIYETVERTGGTGLDVEIAHLWYVDKGGFHEAWEWTTKERAVIPSSGNIQLTVGSYQIVQDPTLQLYAWTSSHLLNGDAYAPVAHTPNDYMRIFNFNGERFVPSQEEPYATLLDFMNARIHHSTEELTRTTTPALREKLYPLQGLSNPHLLQFILEKEQQTGQDWTYQVLLMAGNNGQTTQMTREEITISEQGNHWLVKQVDQSAPLFAGTPTIEGSDPESLQQVNAFLDAQVRRDTQKMKAFFAESMNSRLTEPDFLQSLTGLSNPHLVTYDIIKAETKDDRISYTIHLNMALTDQGVAGYFSEVLVLKKLAGTYKIVDLLRD